MEQWVISKTFEFDYGHRVHNQTLNQEYSLDNACVCRHLHGHRGVVHVSLVADKLTDDMVTDFKHLNWLKQFIDHAIDHKMIMDINDPLLRVIFPLFDQCSKLHWCRFADQIDGNGDVSNKEVLHDRLYTYIAKNELFDNDPVLWELYEGLVVVDFVPTSENLSKWFYDIVSFRMAKIGVTVQSITFNETPKSESIYSRQN